MLCYKFLPNLPDIMSFQICRKNYLQIQWLNFVILVRSKNLFKCQTFFQENFSGKKNPLYLENKHFSKCDFDDQQERKRERKKEICFHSNFFHMILLKNLNLCRKPLPPSFQHCILSTLKIFILYRTFILSYLSEVKWKLNEIFLNLKLLLLMTSSGDVVFWGCAT